MQIIADSGGTKTDWRFIYSDGSIHQTTSSGLNPTYLNNSQLSDLLKQEVNFEIEEKKEEVKEIHFYGAGCQSEQAKNTMKEALHIRFGVKAEVFVHSDMLAAARACCGTESGIVCILGTGSNACLFEEDKITKQKVNLGFILGDEASGAYFGKILLKNFMEGTMPKELISSFNNSYQGLSQETVVDSLYKKEKPNKYLAQFFPFALTNENHPYVKALLLKGFNKFLDSVLTSFPEAKNLPIHFVGGVAFHTNKYLRHILQERQLNTGLIIQSPIAGLTLYHKKQ